MFNRLAGERISIVKIRQELQEIGYMLRLTGSYYNFTIIDTGGIEPEKDDYCSNEKTSKYSNRNSRCYIFIVDGKEGLTAADEEVANMLRK